MVGLAWAGLEGESSSHLVDRLRSLYRHYITACCSCQPRDRAAAASSDQEQIQAAARLLHPHPADARLLHPHPAAPSSSGRRN
jgi:hypothetical protein